MARRYFGTDGVRGVVGETLTPDLVERLGRAATLWAHAGRVFVGRDTRGSGPELEEALVRGIVSGGASAILGGVLPTPAVALSGLDLGVVISASHNPPEYNGVKFFDSRGRKLSDAAEEEIEALLDAPPADQPGSVEETDEPTGFYVDHVVDKFGADLEGLRIAVDCANGAYSDIAPNVFEQLGADVRAFFDQPDGANINVGCGATDTGALQREVIAGKFDLGVAFDGDGDRMLAVDERGESGDGLAAALLLCAALRGRTLSEVAAVMPRWAQCLRNVRVVSKEVTSSVRAEVERLNAELDGSGRVLVRASGTEPLIRVLAEAENGRVAEEACASLAALVERELG